jgi:hypothetical protein
MLSNFLYKKNEDVTEIVQIIIRANPFFFFSFSFMLLTWFLKEIVKFYNQFGKADALIKTIEWQRNKWKIEPKQSIEKQKKENDGGKPNKQSFTVTKIILPFSLDRTTMLTFFFFLLS